MGCNEEQRHIDAAVIKLATRVIALDLMLIGQINGALLPDVLQDWLLGGLQCVVACRHKRMSINLIVSQAFVCSLTTQQAALALDSKQFFCTKFQFALPTRCSLANVYELLQHEQKGCCKDAWASPGVSWML